MAQDTAPRLTFCYGGHDWNVTEWGAQDVKGWAGDAHLLWTHGDKPHWGGSLSLFMDTPVGTGLIWLQDRKTCDAQYQKVMFRYCFVPLNPGLQLGRYGWFMVFLLMTSRLKVLSSSAPWMKPHPSITDSIIILSLWLTLNMSGAPTDLETWSLLSNSATARTHTISLQ